MLPLLLLMFVTTADAADEPNAEPETLVYRQTPQGELEMSVLRPATVEGPLPGVVLFYGGGWIGGKIGQFDGQGQWLADRGMVVIQPAYRTRNGHGTTPFEAVEDAFAAFRYVRENADKFGIDPDRLAAGGGSAGGHLAAALATLDAKTMGAGDADIDPMPNALVLFNPVYDNSETGYGYERVKERWQSFSPTHNLNDKMPPTLVMLGDEDHLIPVATAEAFRDAQKALGVRSKLIIYEGQKHGFFNYASSPESFVATRQAMGEFFASLGWIKLTD